MLTVLLAGCGGPLYRNQPLKGYDPQGGYRFETLELGPDNTDDLFICLTFSGGGTRAAAFAYGVLQGLQETIIDNPPSEVNDTRMLDEVDVISAVSGGSFTAMGYGLWRDNIFDGRLEKRFLRHNVQWDLLVELFRIRNLFRVPFILLDRIDVAAYYYDERIFEGSTYADLRLRNRRPFIVVNATDLTRGQRFEFTQDDFDLLGSDLEQLPVGWAVAASAAFPGLLSPLRFKYFAGPELSAALEETLTTPPEQQNPRRARWARSLLPDAAEVSPETYELDEREHRYIYLLDGGLADNLGLSYCIESYRQGPIRSLLAEGRIKRLVVVIVDAGNDPPEDLESRPHAPGLLKVFVRTGSTGIDRHSAALESLVKYALIEAQPRTLRAYQECAEAIESHCPEATAPQPPADILIEPYVIDVNFNRVPDEHTRRSLFSMITSFFLPTQDVQTLIDAGREVLLEHPEYQRLVNDLAADRPTD